MANEASVAGVPAPHRYTDDEVGLAVTGIGTADAAATVSALLADPDVDLRESYVVSAGIAGTPPGVGTLGAAFLADRVVDWDRKYRWDHGNESGVDLLPFRDRDYAHALDRDLVATARAMASGVDLVDTARARSYRERSPADAARSAPSLGTGTTVSGEEFWHGEALADEAAWLAERYGADGYATTEAEDFGTAMALERHARLDRYLSVRAASNFDRPAPGQPVPERLETTVADEPALRNAFRVASSVVDRIVRDWDAWRTGVPASLGD